ncbi:CapA family protein [Christiangramia crocea]|uniref:CapA family protein n=1 Tax=Christiangramia crocea TaxID=2904124 RepID=A0A9X1UTN3_9FLAO|nr:CapA family protein [Gramella crocea]MCG9970092.1 CapA family protein [Gramella crocea]
MERKIIRRASQIIGGLFFLVFNFSFSQISNEKMKSSGPQSDNTLRLFLAGDVMTGRGIDQALQHSVPPALYESYVKDARRYLQIAERENGDIETPVSYEYIWGDALEVWKENEADFKLINLETSITTFYEPWPRKGIHYRMHPQNIELLKTAGIDYCSLANNHTLDWSRPGLTQTILTLKKAGIKFSGVGENGVEAGAPSILQKSGTRILVFSYGAGNSGIPSAWAADKNQSGVNYIRGLGEIDLERIKENIRTYERQGDLVVLSIHWGGNWGYAIPEDHKTFAHQLIDEAGVDLIFGHSSHHPLGMEVYNEKLIIYGAGDFINDYEGIRGHDQYRPELSLMYFPELNTRSGALKSMCMIPMEIKKFSLHRANRTQTKWLAAVLGREGEKLDTTVRMSGDRLILEW